MPRLLAVYRHKMSSNFKAGAEAINEFNTPDLKDITTYVPQLTLRARLSL